jgi:hypothetical protein
MKEDELDNTDDSGETDWGYIFYMLFYFGSYILILDTTNSFDLMPEWVALVLWITVSILVVGFFLSIAIGLIFAYLSLPKVIRLPLAFLGVTGALEGAEALEGAAEMGEAADIADGASAIGEGAETVGETAAGPVAGQDATVGAVESYDATTEAEASWSTIGAAEPALASADVANSVGGDVPAIETTDQPLQKVSGYITEEGVEVEPYVQTEPDGVEWNNLGSQ